MRSLHLRVLFTVGFGIAVLFPAHVDALIVDDFSDGRFSLTDTTPGTTPEVTTESGLSVIGSVRQTSVNLNTGSQTSGTLTAGGAVFGVPANASGFISFRYDGGVGSGALDSDLTIGGHDRFVITFPSEPASAGAFLKINLSDGSSAFGFDSVVTDGSGTYSLLYSNFSGSLDFTDIQIIVVTLDSLPTPLDFSRSWTFSSVVTAVPEPSTALLLACGLVALAIRKRAAT